MRHENGTEVGVRLGRGWPFSGEALSGLWRALLAKDPASDWTKGRLLTLVVTLAVLVWAGTGIYGAVEAGRTQGARLASLMVDPGGGADDGQARGVVAGQASAGLRSDLFKAPVVRRVKRDRGPEQLPEDVLAQIELQGILGGSNPRGMVMYTRSQETVTVSAGDKIIGFEVVEIRDRSVILKWNDGKLYELPL